MRRIPSTIEDSVAVHQSVVAQKTGGRRLRLEQRNSDVKARIHLLEASGPIDFPANDLGHACDVAPHHPCLRKDLKHCWDSPTAALTALKQRLTDELGYFPCPYCGIGEADTFDHYLPRTYFPEFSATAANLIPSCNRCNLLKNTHSATANERFLHPVIDPLDLRLFKCTIDESQAGLPAPTFAVDVAIAGAYGLIDICQFHFDELKLAERLRRVTAPILSSFLNYLDESTVPWGPAGASVARGMARGIGGAAMPNKWDVLMYGAVADWMDALA